MGKHTIETTGIPVSGYEEDFFLGIKPMESHSMCSILQAAGIDSISWTDETAFGYPGEEMWEEHVKDYRKTTGRQYPPLFKVKLVVEAEKLPDEESDKYWMDQQKRYLEAKKAIAEGKSSV